MAGLTLSQSESQLAEWLASSSAVASGQQYSIAGRSLTRADAKEIRLNIIFWDGQVQRLSAKSKSRVRLWGGIPTG